MNEPLDTATGRIAPGGALLLERLRSSEPFTAVELRPPSSGLGREEAIESWIDFHHALGALSRRGIFTFLTDNAVGVAEEESLTHVAANLDSAVDVRHIVPILTAKHTLDYCITFFARAAASGIDAVTVTGGDRNVGPPRCVAHGSDLRALAREMFPGLALGGWLNPHKPADHQIPPLVDESSRADFALAQIVSHHSLREAESLLEALERAGLDIPVVFGVFHYRSGNPRTLETLGRYFPVPAQAITREFEAGATPDDLCARTLRALGSIGADKAYVSNLSARQAAGRLRRILEMV
ncbi:MAG: hypothetical protein J4G12_07180 [Gemmatimonadetes bacterium]|nr:hypothetical protein [Gemmatimonadota bacterium]